METFNKELNKDEDPEQDFSCPRIAPTGTIGKWITGLLDYK